MATIKERAGRYQVRVRVAGQSAAKTFLKKTDAQAWGRRVQSDMEAGRWIGTAPVRQAVQLSPIPTVPTLAQAIVEYQATVAVKMKGAKDYAYRFDKMASTAFAAKPIAEVTPFDLSQWRDELEKTRKGSTVVRNLALLSGVFSWAMKERGWISSNPLTLVRRPKMGDGRSRMLSDAEWTALLAAAGSSKAAWLKPALIVLSQSAMRRGELFSLRRVDVDYAKSVAHLADTKNGSARDVPLCPLALEALRTLDSQALSRGEDALLPCGAVGSVSSRFARTIDRAQSANQKQCLVDGIEPDVGFLADVRLHDLRHRAGSLWASSGALSLPELMQVSGHKTPRMLTRYAHIQPTALASKMATVLARTPLMTSSQ